MASSSRIRQIVSLLIFLGCVSAILAVGLEILPRDFISHRQQHGGFYDKLAIAFLKGRTWVQEAPPDLLAADNPYDTQKYFSVYQNPSIDIWDHSLYKGKIYLYFGVTPAIVLYAPARMLFGCALPDGLALLILMSLALAGFTAICVCSRSVSCSVPLALCGLSLIGLATGSLWPVLLARARTYEVPIAAAQACATWAIFLIVSWQRFKRLALSRLALASLLLGLTIGSRPHYVIGISLLLCVCALVLLRAGRKGYREILALTLPFIGVLFAIGGYNFFRFEDPLEFGAHYQLGVTDSRGLSFFSIQRLWTGLYLLLLSPPVASSSFPFFTSGPPPAWAVLDRIWIEQPLGYVFLGPWVGFALVPLVGIAFVFLRRGVVPAGLSLAALLFGVVAAANFFMNSIWVAFIDRYSSDWAFFASAAGLLTLLSLRRSERAGVRRASLGLVMIAVLWGTSTMWVLTKMYR